MNDKGIIFEEAACKYLKKNKFEILLRNFQTKIGEIDIICKKDNILIFVEVKGGKDYFNELAYKVDKKKIVKISKVGELFIAYSRNLKFEEVRIDAITVSDNEKISHYKGLMI